MHCADLLHQVRDADPLQESHTEAKPPQVPALLQVLCQRLLPGPAPAHPPQTSAPLPLLCCDPGPSRQLSTSTAPGGGQPGAAPLQLASFRPFSRCLPKLLCLAYKAFCDAASLVLPGLSSHCLPFPPFVVCVGLRRCYVLYLTHHIPLLSLFSGPLIHLSG